jgi:mRNA interferase RelE/StbE
MTWHIEYLPEVAEDIRKIDNSVKPQIQKGILKVAENPVSKAEGGYGTPLGNIGGTNLTGLYKIKFRGIGQRVVYGLKKSEDKMIIVIIAAREDSIVYSEAAKRRSVNDL